MKPYSAPLVRAGNQPCAAYQAWREANGMQGMDSDDKRFLFINMGDSIKAEYGNFRMCRYEPEKQGIKLDDYLIPVFT